MRLAREFPATTFILSHWGGLLPVRHPEAKTLPNLYYDTAASPLLYDTGIWRRFAGAIGADRVLFGSDYPLNLFPKLEAEPEMGRFIAEAKAAGASEDVLSGNAARLLL